MQARRPLRQGIRVERPSHKTGSLCAAIECLERRAMLSGATPAAQNPGGAPNGPFDLTAALTAANAVKLQFYDSANNETGFVVERGESADGPFTPIATLAASTDPFQQVTYTNTVVTGGHTYFYRVFAVNGPFASSVAGPVSVAVPGNGGPFSGTPVDVSATAPATIEAENFDLGGEGLGYHDTTPQNEGGVYRPNEAVDIEAVPGGGFNVGWTHTGEFLNYAVNVETSGYYQLGLRTASLGPGGTVSAAFDGPVVIPSNLTAPDTGDWHTFHNDVTAPPVYVTAGLHTLQLSFGQSQQPGGFLTNVDSLTLTPIRTDGKRYSASNGSALGSPIPVSRFNADGTPDPTFPTVTLPPPTAAANIASALIPQRDGSVVVVVEDHGADNFSDLRLYRISDTGQILQSVTTPPFTTTHGGPLLRFGAITPDGKLLLIGQQIDSTGQSTPLLVERYNPDLTPDSTFGNSGSVQVPAVQQPPLGAVGLDNGGVQVAYDDAQGVTHTINLAADGSTGSQPFGGTPVQISATSATTVQAENFDNGGEGVAYHDTEPQNLGGAYRPSEGVDIQPTADTGDGFNVGWVRPGEWMKYTVNVPQAGNYDVAFRVASALSGGTFHLEVDGIDATGPVRVNNTGGWQNYTTLTHTVALPAGQHTLRLVADTSDGTYLANFNYLTFTPAAGPQLPTISPTGPTTIQAEDFDSGGEGVAYHDTDPQNLGGAYRPNEAVDIQPMAGGGFNVGWTHAGEYLNYTVNVASAGYYRLGLNTASDGPGGTVHLDVDGANVTGSVTAPDTGNWQGWNSAVTSLPFYMTAGRHLLRLAFDTAQQAGGFMTNVDELTFTPIRTDGKSYTATAGGTGQPVTVNRFNADGTPDAGFPPVQIGPTGAIMEVLATVPMADGSVVVATRGFTPSNTAPQNTVLTLISNTGQVLRTVTAAQSTLPTGGPIVTLIGQAPDGKLLLAGQTIAEPATPMLILRYNADLTPDTTFNGTGTLNIYGLQLPPTGIASLTQPGLHNGGGVQITFQDRQGLTRSVNLDNNGTVVPPFPIVPAVVGGRIEAEDFNLGGEGIAYHDTEPQNLGGQYRPTEGVDIERTGDFGDGFDVGWTHTGEYLTYTLHADQGIALMLHARVANVGAGGSFHVEVDGVKVTAPIPVPDTGGFQTYADVFAPEVILVGAGDHQVRIVMDGQSPSGFSGNFNWFEFDSPAPTA